MAQGRNPLADVEAVAAMPGIDEMAEVIDSFGGGSRRRDTRSLLIFSAAKAAFRSGNQAESALRDSGLWDKARGSAAAVGRHLPEALPTASQYYRLGQATDVGEAALCFVPDIAVPLAHSGDLLGLEPPRWESPARRNTVWGDGSIFRALSGVTQDEDGTVHGSRSRTERGPNLATTFRGKRGGDPGPGLPLAVAGVHGDRKWERVMLGAELFHDRDELAASMRMFRSIAVCADGGLQAVVYDGLLKGKGMAELMELGVLPIVDMPKAKLGEKHLDLPDDLRPRVYSKTVRRSGKGGGSKQARDRDAEKDRVKICKIVTVTGGCGHSRCVRALWAVDGALVSVEPAMTPTLDSPVAHLSVLRRASSHGRHTFVRRYWVPCDHGGFEHWIDFASKGPGRVEYMANALRPIPEADPVFWDIVGRRNDVESSFSTFKKNALQLHGRAQSLSPNAFMIDVVGMILWWNARYWDIHIAQHTAVGRRMADYLDRTGR